MEFFSEQLTAVRKEKQLTQEQLAQKMNVSCTSISCWESGEKLPDLNTIKQLSEVLQFDFLSYAAQPSSHGADAARGRKRKRIIGVLLGAVCLLVLALTFVLGRSSQTSHSSGAEQEAAVIVVTPSETVAYLTRQHDKEEWIGWNVNFTFENQSDVPFTPQRIEVIYYENDRVDMTGQISYAEMRPWLQNDKLIKGDKPLEWPFGVTVLHLTAMECIIHGTDDNGHSIQAGVMVHLVPEYTVSE